jgi:site-specific DNA recombinase
MKRVIAVRSQPRNIGAYLRVSTDEQAESGLGIEAQRGQVRAMATVKGWPAPFEYVDNGVSGAKDVKDRPQLKRLMVDVASGKTDAVIIPSLDRLGRRTRIILQLVDDFAERGVTLVSCRESFDTSTPTGQFVLTILAGLAQMERDLASARTKAALAVKGHTDGEMGGTVPYGYMRTEDGPMIDLGNAQTVRRIFMWRRTAHSLRTTAAMLNADDGEGPRGGRWWATSVARSCRMKLHTQAASVVPPRCGGRRSF